jgi:Icc protein
METPFRRPVPLGLGRLHITVAQGFWRRVCLIFLLALAVVAAQAQVGDTWSFVFMTDIHVQPELKADEGFRQALQQANETKPDFILTGGDLIMDALEAGQARADSLFQLYSDIVRTSSVPVYHCVGNHEVFGWSPKSGVSPSHPDYGKRMFERWLGKRYYSFDHKGWHFIILDSIMRPDSGLYVGGIDSLQIAWLQSDLADVPGDRPVIICTHIPFLTSRTQWMQGSTAPNSPGAVVGNSKQVLALFEHHNLKAVLQGHLHFLEEINVQNRIRFITGGAVCGRWWKGPRDGLDGGYLVFRITGQNLSWDYVDYGWKAVPEMKPADR